MMSLSNLYSFSFIEGYDPQPTPGGSDIFNALAQTGDLLWIFIAVLLSVVVLAIVGIVTSKKTSMYESNEASIVISRKKIIAIATAVLLVFGVLTIFSTTKAQAGENHIDPDSKDDAKPFNIGIGPNTGYVNDAEFTFQADIEDQPDAKYTHVSSLFVVSGNGYEDLHANIKISHEGRILFEGDLNSTSYIPYETGLQETFNISITGIDPEVAKSLIGKNDVFYLSVGEQAVDSEPLTELPLIVNMQPEEVISGLSDEGKEILEQEGWTTEDNKEYKKSYPVHTPIAECCEVWKNLVEQGHLSCDGYKFIGWATDDFADIKYVEQNDGGVCKLNMAWSNQTIDSINVKLSLEDSVGNPFDLTEKGKQILNKTSWSYDSESNCLVLSNVSLDTKLNSLLIVWSSDTVVCKNFPDKVHFNYWGINGQQLGVFNNLSKSMFYFGGNELTFKIISWVDEEVAEDVVPAPAATDPAEIQATAEDEAPADEMEEAAVAEEVVVAEEAAVSNEAEAVAAFDVADELIDNLPSVDDIHDLVSFDGLNILSTVALLFYWFI